VLFLKTVFEFTLLNLFFWLLLVTCVELKLKGGSGAVLTTDRLIALGANVIGLAISWPSFRLTWRDFFLGINDGDIHLTKDHEYNKKLIEQKEHESDLICCFFSSEMDEIDVIRRQIISHTYQITHLVKKRSKRLQKESAEEVTRSHGGVANAFSAIAQGRRKILAHVPEFSFVKGLGTVAQAIWNPCAFIANMCVVILFFIRGLSMIILLYYDKDLSKYGCLLRKHFFHYSFIEWCHGSLFWVAVMGQALCWICLLIGVYLEHAMR